MVGDFDDDTPVIPFEPSTQFFDHMPVDAAGSPSQVALMRDIANRYRELANDMVKVLPRNPQRTRMLENLLESRDAAIRAVIYRH